MLLRLPEGAQACIRLGFPSYFRVELAWAKLIGVVVLLAPSITSVLWGLSYFFWRRREVTLEGAGDAERS